MQPKTEGAVPPVEKKPTPKQDREALARLIETQRDPGNRERIKKKLGRGAERAERPGSDIYQELLFQQFGRDNPALRDGGSKKLTGELIKKLDSMDADYTNPDFPTDRVIAEFARQKGLTREGIVREQKKQAEATAEPLIPAVVEDEQTEDPAAKKAGIKDRVAQAFRSARDRIYQAGDVEAEAYDRAANAAFGFNEPLPQTPGQTTVADVYDSAPADAVGINAGKRENEEPIEAEFREVSDDQLGQPNTNSRELASPVDEEFSEPDVVDAITSVRDLSPEAAETALLLRLRSGNLSDEEYEEATRRLALPEPPKPTIPEENPKTEADSFTRFEKERINTLTSQIRVLPPDQQEAALQERERLMVDARIPEAVRNRLGLERPTTETFGSENPMGSYKTIISSLIDRTQGMTTDQIFDHFDKLEELNALPTDILEGARMQALKQIEVNSSKPTVDEAEIPLVMPEYNENIVNRIVEDAQKSDLTSDDEIDAYFENLKRWGVSPANVDAAMTQMLQKRVGTTENPKSETTTEEKVAGPDEREFRNQAVQVMIEDARKLSPDKVDEYFEDKRKLGFPQEDIDAAMTGLLTSSTENVDVETSTASASPEPAQTADNKTVVGEAEFEPEAAPSENFAHWDNPNMFARMVHDAEKLPDQERFQHFKRLRESGVAPELVDVAEDIAMLDLREEDAVSNFIAQSIAERALARPPWLRNNFLDSLIQREGISPRFIEQAREQMRLMEEKRKTEQVKAVNPIQAPTVKSGATRNLRQTIRDGIDTHVQPMVNAADDGLTRGFDAVGQRIMETVTPIKPLTHLTQRPDVVSVATHETPPVSQNVAQAEQPLTAFDAERIFSLLHSIQALPKDQQEAALADREKLMLDPRIAQEVRRRLAEEKEEKQQAETASINVTPEHVAEEVPATEQVAAVDVRLTPDEERVANDFFDTAINRTGSQAEAEAYFQEMESYGYSPAAIAEARKRYDAAKTATSETTLTPAAKEVANNFLEEALRTRSNAEAQAYFQDIERFYERSGFSLVPINEARRRYNEARAANPAAFQPEPAPPTPRRNPISGFVSGFRSRFGGLARPQNPAGNTFLSETPAETQPEPVLAPVSPATEVTPPPSPIIRQPEQQSTAETTAPTPENPRLAQILQETASLTPNQLDDYIQVALSTNIIDAAIANELRKRLSPALVS